MTQTLLVVGHGMVAHRLVEAVRDRDREGRWRVVVVGEEPYPAYDRVALSSMFSNGFSSGFSNGFSNGFSHGAAGRTPEELALVGPGGYADPRVELRLGERVRSVDRAARRVRTDRAELGYDALVLATGSTPFVPPVPGRDLPGCVTYRTLDDVAALRARAAGGGGGLGVGGGLLGLEAAYALRQLGLDVHVVELADRLMPLQVDAGGGEALRRRIAALGVTVHTGTGVAGIDPGPDGTVARVVLGDGTALPARLVVFAAGVRPRDELARGCGLTVGPRGGVAVDETGRTADPAVWAVGECACVAGQVYGLVAPGYALAEVVADRLLGGSATFPGADPSTKLKLLGVDVASFGDAFARGPGALEVVYADPVQGVYKKLVVSDDARLLLGGVLVGDATAYAALRAQVGQPLTARPEELLLVTEAGADLPDGAELCSCRNVTVGAVRAAVAAGCTDLGAVQSGTGAGTGCGSCVPLLRRLLTETGAGQERGLCEHFPLTRPQLFDVVRATGIRTFSELVARHGTGRGCDVCKPVVASILASLGIGHALDPEQAALQDTNDHVLANLQRDGSYSVVPRIPGGEVTPAGLVALGEVARDFGLYTKITGGQRIDLLGARLEQLPAIWRRLVDAGFESGHAYGKAVRTVKSCVGSTWCRYGVQDSVGLAVALELRYRGLRAPHKVKAAVSGCARECAEARGKDVGIIATEQGWNLYVGGNGGFRPRHADLFAQDLDTETLVRYVDRFLMFYVRTADRLQRTATWLAGLDGGLDYLRAVVVDDALGICADLDAAMAGHVAGYADEWRATLEDPERLRRFVSFVNAPDQPDPSIVFVPERAQHRPARPDERAVLVAGPRLAVRA